MEVTAAMVKELRERTGAGVLDCRNALAETSGDFDEASALLQKRGLARAAKKAGREANQGLIEAYVHAGGRVGALVELNCETDFVARTAEFKELAHDLALQIVATKPRYVDVCDVPAEVLEQQTNTYRTEIETKAQPTNNVDEEIANRLESFLNEVCLLRQPFIRDSKISVGDLIQAKIGQVGENIVVKRFARFELSSD
jgi:elongation factor Ts